MCRLSVGWEQLDDAGVDARVAQHPVYQLHDGAVGVVGVASALQHTGVAAFQAEGEDVETHVGPCLIDNPYHAEGHADAAYVQPVRPGAFLERPSQRTGQGGHVVHALGYVAQAVGGQLQAVVFGVGRVHERQVLAVFFQQVGGLPVYGAGHVAQHPVDVFVAQTKQFARGGLHVGKGLSQVHVLVMSFVRRCYSIYR